MNLSLFHCSFEDVHVGLFNCLGEKLEGVITCKTDFYVSLRGIFTPYLLIVGVGIAQWLDSYS